MVNKLKTETVFRPFFGPPALQATSIQPQPGFQRREALVFFGTAIQPNGVQFELQSLSSLFVNFAKLASLRET